MGTPDTTAKAPRGLLARLLAAKKRQSPEPANADPLAIEQNDARVQRYQREFAWTVTQNRCLAASLAMNAIMLAAVVIAGAIASQKPSWMVRGSETPAETAQRGFRVTTYDRDVFRQFAQATLPVLNTADKQGTSRVELLHGIVAEGVLAQKTRQFQRQLKVYQDYEITQTLIVDGVLAIWEPGRKIPGSGNAVERQRFGFYVAGRLVAHVAKSPNGEKFIASDYRALLVVEQSIPNNANPYPFFLASLEERKGDDVSGWDQRFLSNPEEAAR